MRQVQGPQQRLARLDKGASVIADISIASGFCAYAALTLVATLRVKELLTPQRAAPKEVDAER
jgi:hypothetical protein